MVHGTTTKYVGMMKGIPELGIPDLNLQDGPQGVRDDRDPGTSTCWPSGQTIAASFDENLTSQWGMAMGKEFWLKGVNV